MEEIKKRRRKHRSSGKKRTRFWIRLFLYFFYFSAIFLSLYFLFDKKDMIKEFNKDLDVFCWKVFGTSFLFALCLAFWMRKDPKLTGR
jgi:hypothetical protein